MNTDKLPLVSVIVPAYNMESYIAETLDSVLSSEYENIEVLVVDDGSQDMTLEIARSYADKDSRVKVFSQPNSGPSVARNLALKNSSGVYVLPVDADDKIEPTFIGEAVAVLEHDAEVKAVTCRCMFFGKRQGEWPLPNFDRHKLALDNRLCATSMYRRQDAMRIGGYSEVVVAREDWEFWISMLKNEGKVVKLPTVGFHYRVRPASKRFRDRGFKAQTVELLNRLHPEFFERELGGRLHLQRSQSIFRNSLYRLFHPRKVEVKPKYSHLEWYIKALPRMVEYAAQNDATSLTLQMGEQQVVVEVLRNRRGSYKNSEAAYRFAQAAENGLMPIAYYAECCGIGRNDSYCVYVKQ
jgi:glycosyltransferase involved in cell wall biosynthesis